MGLFSALSSIWFKFVILYLIVILIPNLPPKTSFPFTSYYIEPSKELKGALEVNNLLDAAEHILEDRIVGPEFLLAYNNNTIFTGIHGGEVIKITDNHVTFVTKIGKPCRALYEEAECGRPLGLAIDTIGNNLIVADSYYGIWQINLDTNAKTLLVSPNTDLPGKKLSRKAKFFNSVVVDKQGNIFWTDSSSDFQLQDAVYAMLANPSGRLFKYDRVKKINTVLLDELAVPNGLVLSPDEEYLVVAETAAMRLAKYYLKGKNAGKAEIFVDGLPGLPDNLTPDSEGIWVPLYLAVDSEHPALPVVLSNFGNVRKFLIRVIGLLEYPFQFLHKYYPCDFFKRAIHFIGCCESIQLLRPERSTVVRVDWSGNIVGSLHGFDGSVGTISHVLEFEDHLYLGSPHNRFLARIKSPRATKQPSVKITNVRVDGPEIDIVKPTAVPKVEKSSKPINQRKVVTKPTTTTAKTPTTTSKPTTTKTTIKTEAAKPVTKQATPEAKTTKQSPTTTTKPVVVTAKPIKEEKRQAAKATIPITEKIPVDTLPPKTKTLKVINKHGQHVEL